MRAGRFGAYVNWGKVNATIPKSTPPDEITLGEALDLIAEREGRPARPGARKTVKPKTAKSKPKAPAKKAGAAKPAASAPSAKTAKAKPAAAKPKTAAGKAKRKA